MAINTNVSSATLVRALKTATTNETSTINKLSSGKRINRAADDAAGLTINEKLTSKLRGITKAQGNIGDALSVIQRTYGGLSTVMENLQKIRELMVKAANGTNTDYAKTASDLTQNQIQKQSAVSVLTQANAQMGFVVNLLP
jgi:flagellin